MLNLRKNSFAALILLFALTACSTSSFKISNRAYQRVELLVSPDRILLSCLKVSDDENIHLFVMPVLDDKNTVLEVIQSTNLDGEYCESRVQKMNRILKRGRQIYIGGMGDLDKPRVKKNESYIFPGHGAVSTNGRSLQFMFIANELGDCYAAHSREEEPCPPEPFPIKDNP